MREQYSAQTRAPREREREERNEPNLWSLSVSCTGTSSLIGVYQGCARSLCWPALCLPLSLLTKSPVAMVNAKTAHWKGSLPLHYEADGFRFSTTVLRIREFTWPSSGSTLILKMLNIGLILVVKYNLYVHVTVHLRKEKIVLMQGGKFVLLSLIASRGCLVCIAHGSLYIIVIL